MVYSLPTHRIASFLFFRKAGHWLVGAVLLFLFITRHGRFLSDHTNYYWLIGFGICYIINYRVLQWLNIFTLPDETPPEIHIKSILSMRVLPIVLDVMAIYCLAVAFTINVQHLLHVSYLYIFLHSYYFPTYLKSDGGKVNRVYLLGDGSVSSCAFLLPLFFNVGYNFETLSLIWMICSIALGTFLYLQNSNRFRELTEARQLQNRLIFALQEVAEIETNQTSTTLEEKLQTYCEKIGTNMQVEYCAIGYCQNNEIIDEATYTAFELTKELAAILRSLQTRNTDSSLSGSILKTRQIVPTDKRTFYWDTKRHGDLFDRSNQYRRKLGIEFDSSGAKTTRDKILRTGKLQHLLISPMYSSEKEPLGFIVLLNRLKENNEGKNLSKDSLLPVGFTKNQTRIMNTIASQLAVALQNEKNLEFELQRLEEEKFLNELSGIDDINEVFVKMLKYLATNLNFAHASFWLPIEEGFKGEAQPNNLKFIFGKHFLYVKKHASKELSVPLADKEFLLINKDDIVFGDYLESESSDEIKRFDSIFIDQPKYPEISKLFEENSKFTYLIVPINFLSRESYKKKFSKQLSTLIGIMCFKLPLNNNSPNTELERRLKRIAKRLGVIVERTQLRNQFHQLELLRKGLHKFEQAGEENVYHNLVEMIREVIDSETCSLYMLNPNHNALYLKATTAKKATKFFERKNVDIQEVIGVDIYHGDENSITFEVMNRRETTLIFDAYQNDYNSENLIKERRTKSISMISTPIIDSRGKSIGVLNCINRQNPQNAPISFLQGDKDFLNLTGSIVTKIIENIEFNQQRQNFLNYLSHELRNPLHVMLSSTDYLQETLKQELNEESDQINSLFQSFRTEIEILNWVIGDIEIQAWDSSEAINLYKYIPTNPNLIIEKVANALRSKARLDKNIEIKVVPDDFPELYLDFFRIEQAIWNLLDNAVKYSQYGLRNIEIICATRHHDFPGIKNKIWHTISVLNWGIGIADDDLDIIFEEFKRGSNVKKIDVYGTGTGLSVAKKIIEFHSGEIELTNKRNPTKFTIYLPDSLRKKAPSP
ncbi:MAG: ATP-binding protein [Calditrichia bacterium]